MHVFKDVGLVEQLGSGMSRILRVYDKDIFQISDHFIKAVFPYSEDMTPKNTATGDKSGGISGGINGSINGSDPADIIINLMKNESEITVNELSSLTGYSNRKVSRLIKELRENGKITRIGSTRKGYWQINK